MLKNFISKYIDKTPRNKSICNKFCLNINEIIVKNRVKIIKLN